MSTREEKLSFPEPAIGGQSFRLWLAGSSWCDGNYHISRVKSAITVFEYVISGRGTLTVNGKSCEPRGGDVYIVPAGSDHCYYSSSDDPWVKLWFNVGGTLPTILLNTYGLGGKILLRDCPARDIFEKTLQRLRETPEAIETTGPLLIHELIIKLATLTGAFDRISAEGHKLRNMLESRLFSKAVMLSELSESIRRSPAQTLRIFRRDFGVTPHQYQLDRKIVFACDFLLNSRKTIKEIADELGFEDEYYFSHLFRARKGMSPGKFRRTAK